METIKKQFKKVISYSQDIENPQVDSLFEQWYKAKKPFIDNFGGLIYEFPEEVEFTLSENEQQALIEKFITVSGCYYGIKEEIINFLEATKDNFFNNLVKENYTTIDGNIIKKGTKIIKAFKYFAEDKKALREIQDEASKLLQMNKIKGKFCISVHPLDYLSISENNCNWRSCHSLNGEYKAGNLQYMIDDHTVICYIKTPKDEKIKNFPKDVPWNSKIWRVLLLISKDNSMMFAGKQYPFSLDAAMKFIINSAMPIITPNYYWYNWYSTPIISFGNEKNEEPFIELEGLYIPTPGGYLKPVDRFFSMENTLAYIDPVFNGMYKNLFTFSTDYPIYSDRYLRINPGANPFFIVNKPVMCLKCGKYHLDSSESMICSECT